MTVEGFRPLTLSALPEAEPVFQVTPVKVATQVLWLPWPCEGKVGRECLLMLRQVCYLEFQVAQCAFKDLMIHDTCNSHYLSHFAAFFIVARAKRSIAKSCV